MQPPTIGKITRDGSGFRAVDQYGNVFTGASPAAVERDYQEYLHWWLNAIRHQQIVDEQRDLYVSLRADMVGR